MTLLDRYLKAVRMYLPSAQVDDILKELAENILSQREDKEAELGRPLSAAEEEALLKQHGSPMEVAGRYTPDHRTVSFGRKLIGPVLFPFYVKVLTFNLSLTLASIVLVMFALHLPWSQILSTVVTHTLLQFAIITAIFSGAEWHFAKNPNEWLSQRAGSGSSKAPRLPTVARTESFSQLVALSVFFFWLRAAASSPSLVFGPLQLAPVWHEIYLPLALLTIAGMLQAGVNLARPRWTQLRLITRVITGVGWLGILLYLTRAGGWIMLSGTSATSMDAQHIAEVNRFAFYVLINAVIFSAIIIFIDMWRLLRDRSGNTLSCVL